MTKFSRSKGARGELEFAKLLTAEGFPAQRSGYKQVAGDGSPDVECEMLRNYHIEVKRKEQLNIYKAIEQAERDSGCLRPLVAFRKNGMQWYVALSFFDFLEVIRDGYE